MKKAIILLNLGGPDSLDAVEPFLFNLFYDRNIITLPNPIRFFLAKFISKKRTPIAREIYSKIGGKSPILEETTRQSVALEMALNSGQSIVKYKTFIAMRYWHPFSYETLKEVNEFSPDEIILLPLYPQFSNATSGSSIDDWSRCAAESGINIPTKTIYNYHKQEDFIRAHVNKIRKYYDDARKLGRTRILFSAHGLPEKFIKNGDPYQEQIEETVNLIVEKLPPDDLDYVICYQSRVGRLKWIGPGTDSEIERAGLDGVQVVVVPVAFVSEHSETIVELDIEYRNLAEKSGVRGYFRVPALGCDEDFIKSLVEVVNVSC